MKVSDIKGDLGRRIVKWVEDYINNRIFDEVKLFARPLTFCEQISLHNMADFKKFLSGIKVGFPTHACGVTDKPYRSWNMHPIRSGYINKNTNEINVKVIDITDPLFTASIDIIPVSMGSPTKIYWCDLHYCIQCNRDAMMEKLSNMFDEDLVGIKKAIHKDICGKKLNLNDIICYTNTYDNSVRIGVINKFNDCSMVVDGHNVSYDAGVLIVNNWIKFNEKEKHYEYK